MIVRAYKLLTAPGSGGEGSQKQELSQQEKAQIRRAQVRKAQIQHRQRKANYVKELELDVTRVRDMIAQVERETLGLRRENEAMRTRLKSAGVPVPVFSWKGKQVSQQEQTRQQHGSPAPTTVADMRGAQDFGAQSTTSQSPRLQTLYTDQPYDHVNYPPPSAATELFADINVNDIQVTLSMDSTMGTPCYKITSSSSNSSFTSAAMSPLAEEPQVEEGLTLTQQDQAINFILALEYICWNHFHPKDFPARGDPGGRASCHTLMASTFCMASAPDNVYKDRKSVKKQSKSTSSASSSSGPALSWPASGLTLANLRGLAASLNPGDKELTPVQAWFELAASHDVALLLGDEGLVETLKREFVGVVKCVHYGATIERQAFDSIVGRVMGRYAAQQQFAANEPEPMVVDQPMTDQPGLAF